MSADARAEAERRFGRTYPTAPNTAVTAFVAGSEWAVSRPFTEEDVEAAAKVIYENERESIDGARDWPLWEDCRKGSRRSVLAAARAALDAVHARNTARHTKGDNDA